MAREAQLTAAALVIPKTVRRVCAAQRWGFLALESTDLLDILESRLLWHAKARDIYPVKCEQSKNQSDGRSYFCPPSWRLSYHGRSAAAWESFRQ